MDHVEVVVHKGTGTGVVFLGPEPLAALAVLLHMVDDNTLCTLSPHLKPLMRALDKKLIGYKGHRG